MTADIYCGAQTGEWLSAIHQAGGEAGDKASEIASLMLVMLLTLKSGSDPSVWFPQIMQETKNLKEILPEEFKSGEHLLDNIDHILLEYSHEDRG